MSLGYVLSFIPGTACTRQSGNCGPQSGQRSWVPRHGDGLQLPGRTVLARAAGGGSCASNIPARFCSQQDLVTL